MKRIKRLPPRVVKLLNSTRGVKRSQNKKKALPAKKGFKIPWEVIARSRQKLPARSTEILKASHPDEDIHPFIRANHPKSVFPKGWKSMAMDEDIEQSIAWAQASIPAAIEEGLAFLGYPYLSLIAQRPEYRRMSEIIAEDMTRKWIRLKSKSDDEDKSDRISELQDKMESLDVRGAFNKLAEHDNFFGRSHLYIDLGTTDDRDELATPIGNGLQRISKEKVHKGALKALRVIEPVWIYPTDYNSNDPAKPDWYKPKNWFVQGKQYHASRLLTFIGREVPDLLKPAYSFGGLPLTQMVKPYVDNWLRTRQAVSDLIAAFSIFVLSTDMNALLTEGGEEIFKRAEMFNNFRDNHGLMLLNKESEEFTNVAASIGGLHELQAQAQEQMCSASGIPVLKFTGIAPTGLNASTEGEMRSFYDTIKAHQEKLFNKNLKKVIRFIQLSLWGEVDEDIIHEFLPLWSLDEVAEANKRSTEADTDQKYIDMEVISPAEVRQRLAKDPTNPYQGLDVDDLPEQTNEEAEGMLGGEEGPEGQPPQEQEKPKPKPGKNQARVAQFTKAADEFKEAEHPRDDSGKFGSGGGGSSKTARSATKQKHLTETTKKVEGRHVQANGQPLPDHIRKLGIPPAWNNVKWSKDPDAKLLAVGTDTKGRAQYKYNPVVVEKAGKTKFKRVNAFDQAFDKIAERNNKNMQSKDSTTKSLADCVDLISKMGIRPGSDRDTGAAKKAYGASTLEGRHIKVEKDGSVSLDFDSKKGGHTVLHVTDKNLAKMLANRAKSAGETGLLFPEVNGKNLRSYVKKIAGSKFTVKDFRTRLGTSMASKLVGDPAQPIPKSKSEYKKAVKAVATEVSKQLGNTPSMSLKAYINPSVFAKWKGAVGA